MQIPGSPGADGRVGLCRAPCRHGHFPTHVETTVCVCMCLMCPVQVYRGRAQGHSQTGQTQQSGKRETDFFMDRRRKATSRKERKYEKRFKVTLDTLLNL